MSDPTTYPTPTRNQQRAWRRKKERDRANAAYRNSLPSGVQALEALLADAEPWQRAIIETRIEARRHHAREHQRDRRARGRAAIAAE
jgi:hypothetical protein